MAFGSERAQNPVKTGNSIIVMSSLLGLFDVSIFSGFNNYLMKRFIDKSNIDIGFIMIRLRPKTRKYQGLRYKVLWDVSKKQNLR